MWLELTRPGGETIFVNMNLVTHFSPGRLSANTVLNLALSNDGNSKIEVKEDLQTLANKITQEERRIASEAAGYLKQ